MPSDIIQFTIILTKPVLYEKILTLAFAATALLTVNPTDAYIKVYSFKAENNGADASMGLNADGSTFKTDPLHSATLNFKWYGPNIPYILPVAV